MPERLPPEPDSRGTEADNWIRRLPLIGGLIAEKVERGPAVAVLRLAGVIGHLGMLRRAGLTLDDLAGPIDRAFRMPRLQAVALAVNSPGGSPAQSSLIAKRIRMLSEEKKVPVYAFCEDVAASGGYWLACAADEIWCDGASIVGSIGVISAGFGFTDLLDRIGVERRVHTAGDKKSMLDPFRPEDPEDVKRLKDLQQDLHEQFKEFIRLRRGARLKGEEAELFNGEFWSGRKAMELGLVDGIGDLRTVMRQRFGENVAFKPIGVQKSWLQRRLGMGALAAVPHAGPGGWARDLVAALDERALWGRYGL